MGILGNTLSLQNSNNTLLNPTGLSSSGGAAPPPVLSAYSNNGSLSDSNLIGGSSLGLQAGLNQGGNVANQPSVNQAELITASQYNQAQQQQGNNSISNLLQQGGSTIANNLTGAGSEVNSLGNQYLGFAAGTSGAGAASTISGFSGATLGGAPSASGFGGFEGASLAGNTASTTGFGGFGGASLSAGSAPAWTGATFGATLGAAGLGYLGGGLLANALGENATGGSIGGAAGAGIGFAVGGPVGALVGGVAGAVFGGMFGNNSPADQTATNGIDLGTGQINPTIVHSSAKDASGQNSSVANTTAQGASNLAQWLIANGATPLNSNTSGQQIILSAGNNEGYNLGLAGQGLNGAITNTMTGAAANTSIKNVGAYQDQVSSAILQQYNLPPALQSQIQNINNGAFYQSGFNLQNAIQNPNSLSSNPGNGTGSANNFATPTVLSQNTNGRGILQIPTNNPTGQPATQAA